MANMFEKVNANLVEPNVKPAEPEKKPEAKEPPKEKKAPVAKKKPAAPKQTTGASLITETGTDQVYKLIGEKLKEKKGAQNYSFYLDREVGDVIERIAKENGCSNSKVLNTVLRQLFFNE